MRSTRRVHLMLAAGMAALALTALPVGFDNGSLGLDLARAWADPGKGHANGHADARGQNDSHGSVASSLGALNAAHASDTAFAHANPTKSRVGRIAAYRDAALAAQTADQAAADAQANLDAANQAVTDGTQAVTDAQAALDAANALNADADPLNDVDQATIDSLTAARDTAQADLDAAQADLDAANLAVTDNTQAVTDAQAAATTADATPDDALAAAANKPVTDQVIDAVNELLGID